MEPLFELERFFVRGILDPIHLTLGISYLSGYPANLLEEAGAFLNPLTLPEIKN
jgi:hypothetical protein